MTREERFWSKVDKNGPWRADLNSRCWEWTGKLHKGYGRFGEQKETDYAHRIAWKKGRGIIPKGMSVLHRCDYRRCVNYERHLFLGTRRDNAIDMYQKSRNVPSPGELNGSAKLTEKDIKKILVEHSTGKFTQRQLGVRFNVTHSTVGRILKGVLWPSVSKRTP